MAPFYGWDSAASRLQSHYEKTVFTAKSPGVPNTYLIDLGKMKG